MTNYFYFLLNYLKDKKVLKFKNQCDTMSKITKETYYVVID